MDINLRLKAQNNEAIVRDAADQSRSELDKNCNLSTASRLAAIKHNINVNPNSKLKAMYRKVNSHNIGFVGTLPSNKSFSYRSIDKTKLFAIGDWFRNAGRWIGDKTNYLRGEIKNTPERLQELMKGKDQYSIDLSNRLLKYYESNPTKNTDLSEFFRINGINPNNLSPTQIQALNETKDFIINDYRKSDFGGFGNGSAMNHTDLNAALNDKNTNQSATKWKNDYATGLTGVNSGKLFKDYREIADRSDMFKSKYGIDNESLNESMTEARNQMLADQVNTYQNSVHQYQTASRELTKLNGLLKNETDPVKRNVLQSQIRGQQALLNKANSDLRRIGLTGLTDNKQYKTTATGFKDEYATTSDEANQYLFKNNIDINNLDEATKNDLISKGFIKATGRSVPKDSVDRFTYMQNQLSERYERNKKQADNLQNQLNTGYNNLGQPLSESDKASLQKQIADAQKIMQSTRNIYNTKFGGAGAKAANDAQAMLDKGVDANGNALTDQAKAELQSTIDKHNNEVKIARANYQNRSSDKRRQTEVTDVNQFHAITGQNVDTLQDPVKAQQAAQDQYNKARDEYKASLGEQDVNKWIAGLSDEDKRKYKLNTEKDNKWQFDEAKARKYHSKNIQYNDQKFNQGKGRNVYNTLQQANKDVKGYDANQAKQLVSDGNGGYTYGNKQQHNIHQRNVQSQIDQQVANQMRGKAPGYSYNDAVRDIYTGNYVPRGL